MVLLAMVCTGMLGPLWMDAAMLDWVVILGAERTRPLASSSSADSARSSWKVLVMFGEVEADRAVGAGARQVDRVAPARQQAGEAAGGLSRSPRTTPLLGKMKSVVLPVVLSKLALKPYWMPKDAGEAGVVVDDARLDLDLRRRPCPAS